ncbi:MAG TPA: DUF362 domain-containing protein [Gemmataceae bacterium]|nr:DUF362 domain-containing protein [Gemmataceae bacterium]
MKAQDPRESQTNEAQPGLLSRRAALAGMAAGVLGGASLAVGQEGGRPTEPSNRTPAADGIPGPFPGRVVEVAHAGSVVEDAVQEAAAAAMVERGMRELVGVENAVEAWRKFFAPGDVVGIKVNPVGAPHAISNFATVRAIIAGLRSAGVRPRDIVVFDRYRRQLLRAGYADQLPEGVRWDASVEDYDPVQLDIKGYDPDVYASLELVALGRHDPKDDRTRRSHLALLVSRQLDKIINVPVLKDHGSAGVTLALKNLSHGLVNNVSRSHATAATNACNTFIPAIVAMPKIRQKVVLHILDGLKAVYQGGPSARKEFVWAYRSLFFATDPVALDQIGWEIIDAKRKEVGLPPVAQAGRAGNPPNPKEGFDIRQPQHIPLAGALGLGIGDRSKIEHRKVTLA